LRAEIISCAEAPDGVTAAKSAVAAHAAKTKNPLIFSMRQSLPHEIRSDPAFVN
jgi:hypothetical protein